MNLDPRQKYIVSGELLSLIFSLIQLIDRHSTNINKRYSITGKEKITEIVIDDISIVLGKLINFFDNMELEPYNK